MLALLNVYSILYTRIGEIILDIRSWPSYPHNAVSSNTFHRLSKTWTLSGVTQNCNYLAKNVLILSWFLPQPSLFCQIKPIMTDPTIVTKNINLGISVVLLTEIPWHQSCNCLLFSMLYKVCFNAHLSMNMTGTHLLLYLMTIVST